MKQFMPTACRQKLLGRTIENVELVEVVRQVVIPNAVFGKGPLTVHHVSVFKQVEQTFLVCPSPQLQQIELALAATTGQVVPTRLQQQLCSAAEGDAHIGTVDFFFKHGVATNQAAQRNLITGIVTRLQTRAFQVRCSRVFEKGNRLEMHIRRPGHF